MSAAGAGEAVRICVIFLMIWTYYIYLFDSESLEVPEEYMEKPLFKSDRERLCAILQAKDKYGRKVAWTTTKKKLEEEGYIISEGRSVNRRYSVISM